MRVYIFYLRATRGARRLFMISDTFLVYSGGFGKICPHSWDAFVLPTNMHGMWPWTGREGPGVERKVGALVKVNTKTWVHHQRFPRCWCCIFRCMLWSWRTLTRRKSRKSDNLRKDMQQFLFVLKTRSQRILGVHVLHQMQDFSIRLVAENLLPGAEPDLSLVWDEPW